MKLEAVIGHGSRKGSCDLNIISRQIPLQDLLSAGERKYVLVGDFPLIAIEGLLQFDHADRDRQPERLTDLPWENVRRFFVEQGEAIGKKLVFKIGGSSASQNQPGIASTFPDWKSGGFECLPIFL
jgi:hypothetical protein